MMTLNKIELEVQSYRRLPNPYLSDSVSKDIESYILQVDVTKIPEGISLQTNPREQNMRTKVAGRIKEGLHDDSLPFHVLNRGILLSGKSISFDNKNSKAQIDMGDNPTVYGIVDGGHTYRTIIENKQLMLKKEDKQYVRIEVLTGIENIFQNVADSRNTSVQVSDKAIAELNKKFDPIIKDAIKKEPYANNIAYRENEEAPIDVSDILSLIFMFNVDRFKTAAELPVQAYSAKAVTLRDYMKNYDNFEDTENNPYVKMKNIIPDIIYLADEIEFTIEDKYLENVSNGIVAKVRGVERMDRQTLYLERPTKFKVSKGLLYPMIGAFRAILSTDENNNYYWITDPIEMWNNIGKTLVEDTIGRSRSFNNNPNAAGKDKGLWRQNYQTVLTQYLMDTHDM